MKRAPGSGARCLKACVGPRCRSQLFGSSRYRPAAQKHGLTVAVGGPSMTPDGGGDGSREPFK